MQEKIFTELSGGKNETWWEVVAAHSGVRKHRRYFRESDSSGITMYETLQYLRVKDGAITYPGLRWEETDIPCYYLTVQGNAVACETEMLKQGWCALAVNPHMVEIYQPITNEELEHCRHTKKLFGKE
jgi:hypothetical protein